MVSDDPPRFAPHIVLLGEALRPVLRKVEAELIKTKRPSGRGEMVFVGDYFQITLPAFGRSATFLGAAQHAFGHLDDALGRLDDEMKRLFGGVANAADVPDARVHDAVARFEAVVDDLLERYAELRQARSRPAHAQGHELLVAAFREILTQIQVWLREVVDATEDPMEVLKRKGLPTSGSVELVLDFTPEQNTHFAAAVKKLAEFQKWAAAKEPRLVLERALWYGLAAILGLSLG